MTRKTQIFAVFCLLAAFVVSLQPAVANPERWKRFGWAETDFTKTSINFKEIFSGGPPKDGIPPIDDPQFSPVAKINDIGAQEPVITLHSDKTGAARAYPLRVLMWHEIVNDEFEGTPVTVTFCPLCNAAIVFDRRIKGKTLDFGTTGLLRNSDLVMYDRQTQSWWQQFTGQSIVGAMMGTQLKMIPARIESFENYKKRFPKGEVLVPSNDSFRNYGGNPYASYDTMQRPFLFTGELPKDINPMARVIVFEADGKKRAISLKLLNEKKHLKIADVELSWTAGQNSALDSGQISKARDVGNVVVQRRTSAGPKDIVHDITFAFVVKAFLPNVKIQQH